MALASSRTEEGKLKAGVEKQILERIQFHEFNLTNFSLSDNMDFSLVEKFPDHYWGQMRNFCCFVLAFVYFRISIFGI